MIIHPPHDSRVENNLGNNREPLLNNHGGAAAASSSSAEQQNLRNFRSYLQASLPELLQSYWERMLAIYNQMTGIADSAGVSSPYSLAGSQLLKVKDTALALKAEIEADTFFSTYPTSCRQAQSDMSLASGYLGLTAGWYSQIFAGWPFVDEFANLATTSNLYFDFGQRTLNGMSACLSS